MASLFHNIWVSDTPLKKLCIFILEDKKLSKIDSLWINYIAKLFKTIHISHPLSLLRSHPPSKKAWKSFIKDSFIQIAEDRLVNKILQEDSYRWIDPQDFSFFRKKIHPIIAHAVTPREVLLSKLNIMALIGQFHSLTCLNEGDYKNKCVLCLEDDVSDIHCLVKCHVIKSDAAIVKLKSEIFAEISILKSLPLSVVTEHFDSKEDYFCQFVVNCLGLGNVKFKIFFKENYQKILRLNQEYIKLVFDRRRYQILKIKTKRKDAKNQQGTKRRREGQDLQQSQGSGRRSQGTLFHFGFSKSNEKNSQTSEQDSSVPVWDGNQDTIGDGSAFNNLVAAVLAPRCTTIFAATSDADGRSKRFAIPVIRPHALPTISRQILFISNWPDILEALSIVMVDDLDFANAKKLSHCAPILFTDEHDSDVYEEREKMPAPVMLIFMQHPRRCYMREISKTHQLHVILLTPMGFDEDKLASRDQSLLNHYVYCNAGRPAAKTIPCESPMSWLLHNFLKARIMTKQNDDAPYEMMLHLTSFLESSRPGYTALLSRDLGFKLPMTLANMFSVFDPAEGWTWSQQPYKYLRYFFPEIPNFSAIDEQRSFLSSISQDGSKRNASEVESPVMREVDSLRVEVMMLRSTNMLIQQKFDATSKTIDEMAAILRAKPIKVITVHDDNSESVEIVDKIYNECSLDADPAIVDSKFFDADPAEKKWNDSASSSTSSKSSKTFKKYKDTMGNLHLETRVRDKLEDDQFASQRRAERIKELEGILFDDEHPPDAAEEETEQPKVVDPDEEAHEDCVECDELALIEKEIHENEEVLVEDDNVPLDESTDTVDTEECLEEIVIDEEDDQEHDSKEPDFENHSDYSDYLRESERLKEVDCSMISDSNLSDSMNLTMDTVAETERRLQKQVFPEADLVMEEIESFMQESPIVKSSQGNPDRPDVNCPSLPSPVPSTKKLMTPLRVVSRDTICARADMPSPATSSLPSPTGSSVSSSTPARPAEKSYSPTFSVPNFNSPLPKGKRCLHPGITTQRKLSRRYIKARRQGVVKVSEQILKAKLEGIQKIQVAHIINLHLNDSDFIFELDSHPQIIKLQKAKFYYLVFNRDIFIFISVTGDQEGRRHLFLISLSLSMLFKNILVIPCSEKMFYFYLQPLGGFQLSSLVAQWMRLPTENTIHCCSFKLKTQMEISHMEVIKCQTFYDLFIFAFNLFKIFLIYFYTVFNIVKIYSNVMLMCRLWPISSSLMKKEAPICE